MTNETKIKIYQVPHNLYTLTPVVIECIKVTDKHCYLSENRRITLNDEYHTSFLNYEDANKHIGYLLHANIKNYESNLKRAKEQYEEFKKLNNLTS